ncbi:MAG TPA: serine/threonine-protein kinase [Polyangia bacterium]|nr:serine/threonine-protein kinase [Polyangia bacterium]
MSVIVACPRCALQVDVTAIGTVAGPPRFAPEIDRTGQTIGGFQVESRLGAGGMGTVYRAVPEAGGKAVALKFLSAPLGADADLRGRFAREVKVMRDLAHPGIVRVLADGQCDGLPWFAMELLTGSDLGARIKRGPLGAAEVAALFPPLLDALAHAHRANLVHRDLKPANVLLDTRGAPHLADFGIARPVGEAALTRLTETAAVLGTLAYMAPEQRAGGDVDARADLFSVGVMLYEAVTGRVPLGAFPPASRVARGFSRAFDRVIERLLAPDPEARFASAEEAKRALIAALRPRRLLAVSVGGGALLASGLAIAVWAAGGHQTTTPMHAQGIDEYQQPGRVKVGAAADPQPAEHEPQPPATRDAPRARRRGWVFLGTHDAAAGAWTKSYFNVGQRRPEDIKPGQTVLTALGRSNVRGGMPNQLGLFYDVIDVVREGTGVGVDAVARWENSSYVWAKVHYDSAPAR